jgi:glycosyltransferase involved in cell wall biosynthesis
LQQEQPDLVHVDEEPYNLATYLAIRSAARLGIPALFFTWQNIQRRYPPPFAQMERAVYRASGAAIAGSAEAERVLRRKGFTGPISVIPQFGVDTSVFAPGRQPPEPFTIGFFNRLIPAKGPLLAIEALAMLPVDTRMLMVGDGPLRDRVDEEIIRRGLEGRVTRLSRVPSTEMPDLVRRVHVSILPSLATDGWKEQFGRVLIEAMAAGVPVVGSDSGEIPEVVGDAGILVPEGNAAGLAGALQRLYDDSGLRAELGIRGRQRVADRYTHQRIAEQSVAAYRDVIESTR